MTDSILKVIRDKIKTGFIPEAHSLLSDLLNDEFGLKAEKIFINNDDYSLNSVNGKIYCTNNKSYFFKFHQEDGEEDTLDEYYHAELLKEAGYYVDQPDFICQKVGKQILLYPLRDTKRFADLCFEHEFNENQDELSPLIKAQENLDKFIFQKYCDTLHIAQPDHYKKESILQLFYWRLIDIDAPENFGGRLKNFYLDKDVNFPNQTLPFNQLLDYHWIINGIEYPLTLRELFTKAKKLLAPEAIHTPYPAVISHGDAHNANVWFEDNHDPARLSFFDPAFAGKHIHALLAEIKPTFHNIFAHPYWMYVPDKAKNYLKISCKIKSNKIFVDHNWQLPPLRKTFLESKINYFWKPWLNYLKDQNLLMDNWEDYIQSALFCCPTLVTNLRVHPDNRHTKQTSLLGFSVAMMMSRFSI